MYYIISLFSLKLFKVDFEFLRGGIDTAHLVYGLDTFGADSETDIASKIFTEESFPLQINMLNFLVPCVTEGNNPSLSIRFLAQ